MLHPPNTFLQYWTLAELQEWIKELKWRNKSEAWKDYLSVPTLKQTKEELNKRY